MKTDFFQHLGRIEPLALSKHLTEQLSSFELSHSNYAKNRLQKWFFSEPTYLGSKELLPRQIDYRLLALAKRLGLKESRTIALATFHGLHNGVFSDARISPHRDASYAEAKAYLLNDGGHATFLVDEPGFERRVVHLRPGDLICFNSKFKHSVVDAEPGRFSLVFWQTKKDCYSKGPSLADRLAEDKLLPF